MCFNHSDTAANLSTRHSTQDNIYKYIYSIYNIYICVQVVLRMGCIVLNRGPGTYILIGNQQSLLVATAVLSYKDTTRQAVIFE